MPISFARWETIHNGGGCFDCVKTFLKPLSELATPHWTKQFESIAVGIGALLAGFGGLKILLDWLRQTKVKRKASKYRKRYPYDLLNKKNGYQIVKIKTRNEWWLLDKMNGMRHWIKNLDTVGDLGWRGVTPDEIKKSDLEKHLMGGTIDTKEL